MWASIPAALSLDMSSWIEFPVVLAMKDSDGYYWLLGRADEVMKVSGHRIGTIEIEDALVSFKEIAELT